MNILFGLKCKYRICLIYVQSAFHFMTMNNNTLFVLIFARIYFRAPFTKIRNSVLIFAQFRANCWLKALFCIAFFKIWSLKIFARINFRAPATNLQKFGTNFRAISRKSRFCAKMRENLSARKLVRILWILYLQILTENHDVTNQKLFLSWMQLFAEV